MTTSNDRLTEQVGALNSRVGTLETWRNQQELGQKALHTQLETVYRILVNHVEATNQRFNAMERKLDEKFASIDQRFDAMDQKLDQLIALFLLGKKHLSPLRGGRQRGLSLYLGGESGDRPICRANSANSTPLSVRPSSNPPCIDRERVSNYLYAC